MSEHETAIASEPDEDPRVTEALEEYLAALEAGQLPDRAALAARYPDVAHALGDHLDGLEFLHRTVAKIHDSTSGDAASCLRSGIDGPGPTIFGGSAPPLEDYQIVREVGRGGMGIVYEAIQKSLRRRVALKVLPGAATLDSRQLQRFKNESQAAAQLNHPNIVPVFAVGCEQGAHYYAMRFIDGQTLGQHIQERAAVRDRAFFERAAWIGVQAAEALEHAHQMGVIHRDVKPGNLLLDDLGRVWVTDFGLARWSADGAMTTTGDLLGTLRYMSPEQAAARRGLVDHRTDVYSLGATLYELVTLRPVFAGADHGELLHQVLHDEPAPPRRLCPRLPRDLETILLKALAKRVEDRYATAQDMADDLRRFLADRPVLARRPTLWERAGNWTRRHRHVTVSAAVLLVFSVVALTAVNIVISREQAKTNVAYDNERHARSMEAVARRTEVEWRKKEAAERARAEENFRQARRLVDYLAEIAAVDMASESDMTNVRRKVLQAALSYYEDFIKQQDDDNRLTREQLLRGYARVATLLDAVGRPNDAKVVWNQLFKLGMTLDHGRGGFRLVPVSSKLRLLRLACVQTDLKLNSEQMRAIGQLEAKLRDRQARGGGEPDDDPFEASEKEAVKLLSSAQAARLSQLLLRQRGIWAFQDAAVSAALELTPGQREALAAIQRQAQARQRSPAAVANPGRKSSMDRILSLLTAEQKSRWHDLIGQPFLGTLPPSELVLSMGRISIQLSPAGPPENPKGGSD